MYYIEDEIQSIFFHTNQLYGTIQSRNDNDLAVESQYQGVLPPEYGPGLYYTLYGAILRRYIKGTKTKEEHLRDERISPISYIPYESVVAIEGIEAADANMPKCHYEELKVLAVVSTDIDVCEGSYIVRDIVFDDIMFSTASAYKKFIQGQISKNFGWVDLTKNANTLVLIQQKNAAVSQIALKSIPGVTCLGIHKNEKDYYYVGWGGCLDKHNKIVDKIRGITTRLEVKDTDLLTADYQEVPGEFRENVFKFNDAGLCSLAIGTWSSFFLKERLKAIGIKVPILGFIGLSGAGKTATLENVLMPMMGMNSSDVLMSKSPKEFALIKRLSSHNMIPCILSEYKPDELSRAEVSLINNLINNSYDGSTIARGRSDQSINYYTLNSPLVVVGEGFNGDKSKLERMIILLFNELEAKSGPFRYLQKNKNILLSIGKAMTMRALSITDENLLLSFNNNRKYIKDHNLSPRCSENLLCALLGIDLFCEVCDIDADDYKPYAVHRYLTDTLISKGHTTNAIEQILEDLSNMSNERIITHEDWTRKKGYLYLNLAAIYPKYRVYLRTQNEGLKLSKGNFEQQALGFKTCIKKKVRLVTNQGPKWSLGFDIEWLEKIAESKQLDFSGFDFKTYEDEEREALEDEQERNSQYNL